MNTSQKTNQLILLEDYIDVYVQSFLDDKKSQNLSIRTNQYYSYTLKIFVSYCDSQSVKTIAQITPSFIRTFILYLENKGNNVGGQLFYFRAIKCFLRWYWDEREPDYTNPITKVKPPKNHLLPLEGVSKEQVSLLLSKCRKDTFLGERNKTILMLLFDTGLRAQELCDIELEFVELGKNSIFIPRGKGGKSRTVFFGSSTRKQLRHYLRFIRNERYLFTNQSGDKLIYNTLRQLLRKLCILADIKEISLHDFRRGFALEAIRQNVDLLSLSRLLGHSDLSLLQRYVNQNKEDLRNKFNSVVDRMKK